MKAYKYSMLLLFLFWGYNLFAQHLIDSTKLWSILHIDAGDGGKWRRTYTYKFGDVTTKNDTTFAKLYHSRDENLQQWVFNSFWIETSEGKAYQSKTSSIGGNLKYDFTLMEKDTFVVNFAVKLVVDSVRVKEWGGKLRKLVLPFPRLGTVV